MVSKQALNQTFASQTVEGRKHQRLSFRNRICVVIPTYNESKNITSLLNKIFSLAKKYQKKSAISLHVLIVDDNSPDGTADVVKEYIKKNPRVHILQRKEKEGLGAAYIAGMKHAMKTLHPEIIFEMDGDHSHNPKDIFRMIDEIEKGSDFVIGSRYVDGGRIPNDWGAHRKVISALASGISRYGLGLQNVKDCSGGFRAMRKDVLKTVNLDSLNVKGYAFQVALLESVVHHGFDVKEIPIKFHNRNSGESKMRFSDMVEGWKIIFTIRAKRTLSKLNA